MAPRAKVLDLKQEEARQSLLKQPTTQGMRCGKVHLEAGERCGQHSTKGHEEVLVFLEGSGKAMTGDGQVMEVGRGKICYIPSHTEHDIANTGSEPLVYIYCVAPVEGQ